MVNIWAEYLDWIGNVELILTSDILKRKYNFLVKEYSFNYELVNNNFNLCIRYSKENIEIEIELEPYPFGIFTKLLNKSDNKVIYLSKYLFENGLLNQKYFIKTREKYQRLKKLNIDNKVKQIQNDLIEMEFNLLKENILFIISNFT